jgi:hypothetical protein
MYACTYWMTLKSSARDMAKCEHKLLLNVWPALVISAYTMMNGRPAVPSVCEFYLEYVRNKGHTASTACADLRFRLQISDVVDAILDTGTDLAFQNVLHFAVRF